MNGPVALRTIVNSALAAAVAYTFCLLYAPVVKGLALEWVSSPDSSYGLLLVGIAALVIWRRRAACAGAVRLTPARRGYGLVLLIVGLLTFLAGSLGADIFITRVSLIIVLAGSTWFFAGRAVRVVAAPFFFLLIAIPLPALVVNTITLPLQLIASQLAERLLVVAGFPVFRDGNILELRSTTLEVAQACSGLRSLISLTAVACVIAWASDRPSMRALIILAATPIAVALNGIRIAATGMACETWGRHMASGGWHELTGWLTFTGGLGLLLALQRMLASRGRVGNLAGPELASA